MSLVRIPTPTPVQGVSQQPAENRLPGQVGSSQNSWPSPVEGLGKRQPTQYLGQLSTDRFRDALVHPIQRDERERYVALCSHEQVKVFDLEGGTERTVLPLHNLAIVLDDQIGVDQADTTTGENGETTVAGWDSGVAAEIGITVNDADGPEGSTVRAARLDDLVTTNVAEVNATFTPPAAHIGRQYLVEIDLKRDDSDDTSLLFVNFASATSYTPPQLEVDLTAGTIGTTAGLVRSKIANLGDGWYRVSFVFTWDSAGTDPTNFQFFLYPAAGFGITPNTSSGAIWATAFKVYDLNSTDFSYLDLEQPNDIVSPKDFSTTWIDSATDTETAADSSTTGPYGYDLWQRIGTTANGSSNFGTYTQVVGEFFSGRQCFSCYFMNEDVANDADEVRLILQDDTNAVDYEAVFGMSDAGVLTLTSKNAEVRAAGVIDHGGGAYQAYLVFDPDDAAGTAAGDIRDLHIQVSDSDAGGNRTVLAWGALIENGVSTPSPFTDPRNFSSAATVADTTFVNTRKATPAMTTELSPATSATTEGLFFIRQGGFNLNYTVKLNHGGTTDIVQVQTEDGDDGTTTTSVYTYEIEITDGGTPGSANWELNVNGATVSYDTSSESNGELGYVYGITDGLVKKSAGAANYKIYAYFDRIRLEASGPNVGKLTTLTCVDTVSGGTAVLNGDGVETPDALIRGGQAAFDSVSTDAIAGDLSRQLNALTNITSTVAGSTVLVQATDGDTIESMEIQDGNGNQNTLLMWKDAQFFDELPTVAPDSYRLRITGNEDEDLDDYYIKFRSEVPGQFGTGTWQEDVAPGIEIALDSSTMPHQLVRRQDDSSGLVTGEAFALYFTWEPVPWAERGVGDDATNPTPSLVGTPVRDLFFWKSRLGFLAGTSVIMSEAAQFTNPQLFRTTVRALLSTDPIDIGSSSSEVAEFNRAQASDERMLLFSDRQIFTLTGEPTLTSQTAELTPRLKYDSSDRVRPSRTGRSLLFLTPRRDFTIARELIEGADNLVDANEVSAQAPNYIEGEPLSIHSTDVHDVAFILADGDRSTLYVYNWFWLGQQKGQSAWHKWDFGSDTRILGAVVLDNLLYLVNERSDGAWLECMQLGDGISDTDSTYVTRLDRRLDSDSLDVSEAAAGSPPNEFTTITLPYELDPEAKYEVVSKAGVVLGEAGTGFRNLLTQTENFQAGVDWTSVSTCTPTANNTTDPLGGSTGSLLADGNAGAASFMRQQVVLTAGDYNFSCYFKENTADTASIQVLASGVIEQYTDFTFDGETCDLVTVTAPTDDSAVSCVAAGGGWYRLAISFTLDSDETVSFNVYPAREDVASTDSSYAWGAQVTAGRQLQPYERVRGKALASGGTDIEIPLDHTGTDYWVGQSYRQLVDLTRPLLKGDGANPQFSNEGNFAIQRTIVSYSDAGEFAIVTQPQYRDKSYRTFTQTTAGTPENGELSAGVYGRSRELLYQFVNESPFPANLLGIEWLLEYRPRGGQLR